jgi:phosphate-selective porin OprO and OprP
MIHSYRGILLASVAALMISAPLKALAQDTTTASEAQAEAEAKAAMLEAQLEAMQAQLDDLKDRMKKKDDGLAWKGAPQFVDKDKGWEFKVRGRIMWDTAYLSAPGALTETIVNNGGQYGLRTSFRRARIGVEGKFPGDFGYKAEFDFANAGVGFGDVVLTHQAKDSPLKIILGNHETWESLEQVSSSRFISFIERAQMNEAFINSRKLGISAQYRKNDVLISGGVFGEQIPGTEGVPTDGSNDGWLFGTRWNYNPKIGNNQLHLGANFQYRNFREANLAFNYQARPFSARPTNIRFVSTGNLAVKSDYIMGAEAALIRGPLHLVTEAQYTKPTVLKPGEINSTNTNIGGVRLPNNPDFLSFYAEAGFFFTGETRGYKAAEATWDRVKVNNPFDKGGWGAWQVVGRFDYLDLSDNVGAAAPRVAGNVATGNNYLAGAALGADTNCVSNLAGAQCYVNGGKQYGYLLGLNWYPTDYVRFMLNFTYIDVKGIPLTTVAFVPATGAGGTSISGTRVGTTQATGSLNTTLVSFRTAFDF